MATDYELRRAKVELIKVQAAKAEMEFRVFEKEQEIIKLQEAQERIRSEEIGRIKSSIEHQEKKEQELMQLING